MLITSGPTIAGSAGCIREYIPIEHVFHNICGTDYLLATKLQLSSVAAARGVQMPQARLRKECAHESTKIRDYIGVMMG